MTSVPKTGNYCTAYADKGYTSFTWVLKDWSLLNYGRTNTVSPKFVLNNTGGKLCSLSFSYNSGPMAYPSVRIQFPLEILYQTMVIRWYILDEELVKRTILSTNSFQNSNQNCLVIYYNIKHNAVFHQHLQDDTIIFFFEFTIAHVIQDFTLPTDIGVANFGTDICQNCKLILDSKYDVTFAVRGKKLYAHKVILAENSEVFRAMFTSPMKELEDGTVEIVDTDATVFEAFLRFMYRARVSEIENLVDELIVVADKYQVLNLKKACERYMTNHINDATVILYLEKAHHFSCNELKEKCIHFVRNNIHILGNSSVLAMLSEYPNDLLSQIFAK